ncbi:restriction endonuclease [Streptomyces sp. NPDC001584]|uniref:restriction endonuclease n=1 Tax=Streptomyces sp. NPDC001584 TaxID=3154521 RepID=UPI00332FCF1C
MASTSRRPRPARRTSSRRRHPATRGHNPAARGDLLHRLAPADRAALAALAVVALVTTGHYLSRHPAVLATLLVLLGLGGIATACLWGRGQYRRWRRTGHGALPTRLDEWRNLSPAGFEHAVARLCRRDGCTRVQVLGGANDRAGDVRARTPDGRWILVQCKRYGPATKVTAETLHQVNGTYRDTHRCDLAAVVTTNTFTSSAVDWNCELPAPLKLFGSRQLLEWANHAGPAPW